MQVDVPSKHDFRKLRGSRLEASFETKKNNLGLIYYTTRSFQPVVYFTGKKFLQPHLFRVTCVLVRMITLHDRLYFKRITMKIFYSFPAKQLLVNRVMLSFSHKLMKVAKLRRFPSASEKYQH